MPDNVIPFWRKIAERTQAEEAKRAQVFEQMDVALVLIGILAEQSRPCGTPAQRRAKSQRTAPRCR
jgi:hypothetical protein